MSGEHEKGSHGDGGGEGYLKYLDGSLRDEANQGRPVPKTRSVDIVEDGTPGPGTAMEFPVCCRWDASPGDGRPGLQLPGRYSVVEARPGQARLGPGEVIDRDGNDV